MKPSIITLLFALPGAIFLGWFGLLAAAFSGDGSPTAGAHAGWLIWGVLGGACMGAMPGVVVGLLLKVRWVWPVLGGAVGSLPGWLEGFGFHLFGPIGEIRPINVAGYASAALTLFGIVVGTAIGVARGSTKKP